MYQYVQSKTETGTKQKCKKKGQCAKTTQSFYQKKDRKSNAGNLIHTLERNEELLSHSFAAQPGSQRPVIQRQPHPLDSDEAEVYVEIYEQYCDMCKQLSTKPLDLKGFLLEKDLFSASMMDEYRRSHPKEDTMLFQSILATIELHKAGRTYTGMSTVEPDPSLSEEDADKLKELAWAPYPGDPRVEGGVKQQLLDAYGLDPIERWAVEAYTSPNKQDPKNPYNMRPSPRWGAYKDGWKALGSALRKLPSLGRLGIRATTYRAPRTRTESEAFSRMPVETNIIHGQKAMDAGQHHWMSTSLTYSVHTGNGVRSGGMMAMTGESGVLINPFGCYPFSVDGGEVLYPPGVISRYEGAAPRAYKESGQELPVFHLREVREAESFQSVREDRDFGEIRARHPQLDEVKLQIIKNMEEAYSMEGGNAWKEARRASGILGDVMYLTYDELHRLQEAYRRQMISAIQEKEGTASKPFLKDVRAHCKVEAEDKLGETPLTLVAALLKEWQDTLIIL